MTEKINPHLQFLFDTLNVGLHSGRCPICQDTQGDMGEEYLVPYDDIQVKIHRRCATVQFEQSVRGAMRESLVADKMKVMFIDLLLRSDHVSMGFNFVDQRPCSTPEKKPVKIRVGLDMKLAQPKTK